MAHVATQVMMISDTHGEMLTHVPDVHVDVLIHCGDLTNGSQLHEYQTTINALCQIKSSLKLVIAGNHDWTLDRIAYTNMLRDATRSGDITTDEFIKTYGSYEQISQAQALFQTPAAGAAGIVFLEQGTHVFRLANGARLKVHASPFTPMLNGNMGFQYEPTQPHSWRFDDDIDIPITHGPPQGVHDRSDGKRLGCPKLFAAVAKARPRVHCFGHVHGGWGARMVTWRDQTSAEPTHFDAIDNRQSKALLSVADLRGSRYEGSAEVDVKESVHQALIDKTHALIDEPICTGAQTLFVNAAIKGSPGEPQRVPWLVNIALPGLDVNG